MRTRIKAAILRYFPSSGEALQLWWRRRHLRRLERRSGVGRITRAFRSLHGSTVMAGPFKGLIYPEDVHASALVAKLAGAYEAELHCAIHTIQAQSYKRIINIGCAEGYYAVGLARLLPSAEILAFDSDPVEQKRCRRMALANGVADRVLVSGRCDTALLSQLLVQPGDTLIVIDCEGCEYDLLNPAEIPQLRYCALLVELHLEKAWQEELKQRFATFHDQSIYTFGQDLVAPSEALRVLSQADRALVQREWRDPGQECVLLLPKGTAEKDKHLLV